MIENKIRLTQTVQKGGCAAKIAATELRQILSQVRFPPNTLNVLVDGHTMDDAGIFKVNDNLALVQTLDFFTPIVDTPYLFGKIAAANALSDVYAMGGRPQTAMAILAFPLISMSHQTGIDILQGASDVIAESKSVLIGGHSIDDETLKFGLSVTGYVHPDKMWTNANAKVGDVLILTKPIGTGAATAALKKGLVQESDIADVLESMSMLNNIIDLVDEELLKNVHAATDLTGFGLAGHAMQMAKASEVSFAFECDAIPLFKNFSEFIHQGCITKAHRTNREYTQNELQLGLHTIEKLQQLFDPQTSGGLLLSVAESAAANLLTELRKKFPRAQQVGRVLSAQPKRLVIN